MHVSFKSKALTRKLSFYNKVIYLSILELGPLFFVRTHKVKWNEPKWRNPYKVLLGLLHSVKIKRRTKTQWVH